MMLSIPSPTVATSAVADLETSSSVSSMLDLLYPLSEFLSQGEPCPVVELEAGKQPMPEPYRSLLVHERDMTSTLERFHGEPLELRLLGRHLAQSDLFRQVVLIGMTSGRAVEFGAIRIDLDAFAPEPRQRIQAAKQPLGSILAEFGIRFISRPRLFFHLESNRHMEEVLGMRASALLYGRQNVLSSPAGLTLAEVVEILPPASTTEPVGIAEAGALETDPAAGR